MIASDEIYQEDCVRFMDKLCSQGMRVDVIITSPPYNINKDYRSYFDNRERNEYLSWLFRVAKRSFLILKHEGSFFLNLGGSSLDPLLPFEAAKSFIKAGYILQNTIHWIKSISLEKEDVAKNNVIQDDHLSVGHFKPIVSERFLTDLQEYIFHFTKKGNVKLDKLAAGVPYQDKTNIGRWKSAKQDRRDRGNVWFIPYPTIQEGRPHPAVFPEKLPYLCTRLHGIKSDMLVYDPFMGIGNTALACINQGIQYIGTEIDADYIRIARENIVERKKAIARMRNERLENAKGLLQRD